MSDFFLSFERPEPKAIALCVRAHSRQSDAESAMYTLAAECSFLQHLPEEMLCSIIWNGCVFLRKISSKGSKSKRSQFRADMSFEWCLPWNHKNSVQSYQSTPILQCYKYIVCQKSARKCWRTRCAMLVSVFTSDICLSVFSHAIFGDVHMWLGTVGTGFGLPCGCIKALQNDKVP